MKALKIIFSCFGIPKIYISDNIPFNIEVFIDFAKDWNFELITTSPNYPQSNGLAKKSVGIAENFIKKLILTGKDLALFLLDYRNTPVAGS